MRSCLVISSEFENLCNVGIHFLPVPRSQKHWISRKEIQKPTTAWSLVKFTKWIISETKNFICCCEKFGARSVICKPLARSTWRWSRWGRFTFEDSSKICAQNNNTNPSKKTITRRLLIKFRKRERVTTIEQNNSCGKPKRSWTFYYHLPFSSPSIHTNTKTLDTLQTET